MKERIKPEGSVKSAEEAWAAGKQHTWNTAFLGNLPGGGGDNLDSYDIDALLLVCDYTITPSGGAFAAGRDFARMFDTIEVFDADGRRYNLSGTSARLVSQAAQRDVGHDMPDSAVDTATSDRLEILIPFAGFVGQGIIDERDATCPARALRKGKIRVKCSGATLATNVVMTSGTMYVEALYRRRTGRRMEAPIRITWEEHDIAVATHEQLIPVGANLFAAYLYADLGEGAASGATTFGDSIAEFDSRTLDYSDTPLRALTLEYVRHGPVVAAENEFTYQLAPYAVPLFEPSRGMILSHLLPVDDLHFRSDGDYPANTVCIIGSVPDVGEKFFAAATRVKRSSVEQVRKAHSRVATRDGRKVPLQAMPAIMQQRLPVKVN